MNFIEWEEKYELGMHEIDTQHQRLIGILNKLYKAFVDRESDTILKQIVEEMNDYAKHHFQTEEIKFQQYGYAYQKEHILEHDNYNNTIKKFSEELERGHSITFKVMNFLRKWWTDHILVSDKKYADIFQQAEKSPSNK